MKRFIAAIMLLPAALIMSSCGKDEEITAIRFLFEGENDEFLTAIVKDYREKANTLVALDAVSDNYEDELIKRLDSAAPPTIFEVHGTEEYLRLKAHCANIGGTELEGQLTDKSLALLTSEGVFGVPFSAEAFGIIYNERIMNEFFAMENRETMIASASDIKNFDDLKEVVTEMSAKKEQLGIDGVFAAMPYDAKWAGEIISIPLYYEIERKNIDIEKGDLDKFELLYAENLKNILDLYTENSVVDKKDLIPISLKDAEEEFISEKCAMMISESSVRRKIEEPEDPKKGVKMLPLYTGMDNEENDSLAVITDKYLCINKNASAEEQKAAQDFLCKFFSSRDGKRYVSSTLGIITPFNTFSKSELPMDALSEEVFSWINKNGLETIPLDLTLIPSEEFEQNLAMALLSYASGKKSWDSLKEEIVADWKKEIAA